MYNWSFVRLPFRVSFLTYHGVRQFLILFFLLAFRVCPLNLIEASCTKGTNVPVQIVLDWESSWGGVYGWGGRGLEGSVVVL